MKKLIIGIFGLILIMFYSCSKEMIEPDQTGDLKDLTCGKDGLKIPKGPVFTVYPNGLDDTEALIQAFADAKATGPGSVVQLVQGQYTIGMVEVRDFNGYFLGAGRGKTIISNLPELPCEACWEVDVEPYLLQFVGGKITVAEMTIRLNDGPPCADGTMNKLFMGDLLASMLTLADYTSPYVPANRYIVGIVRNVDFIAGNVGDGINPYGMSGNVGMSVYCGAPTWFGTSGFVPPSSGEFVITGCRFEQTAVGPDAWGLDEKSKLTVENNSVIGTAYGMFLGGNIGGKITIKNNKFKDEVYWGIFIDNEDWGFYPFGTAKQRTEFNILNNYFEQSPGVTSIYVRDSRRTVHPDEGFPQLIEIKSNTFTSQDGATTIIGLNNVDAKIWNNRFDGTGAVGVMLDGTEATSTYAENNKIMGNNFLNATYTGGNVYLGPFTKNCMVVGVSTDKVVDFGVNNSVIGVKAQKKGPHYNPGMHGHFKNMQENMMRMRPSQTI
jgi:hypothetical protein